MDGLLLSTPNPLPTLLCVQEDRSARITLRTLLPSCFLLCSVIGVHTGRVGRKLFNPSVPSWGKAQVKLLQGSPLLLSLKFLTLQCRGIWCDSIPLWLAPGQDHCLWWFPHTLEWPLNICSSRDKYILDTESLSHIYLFARWNMWLPVAQW